jgi:hypothetical protein
MSNDELPIYRYLNIPICYYFINKLEEYNAILGQQQIENIHYTISLIEHKYKQDKIDNLMKINIQKCIQWCLKNNIEYNNMNSNINIFTNDYIEDVIDNDSNETVYVNEEPLC